jgi:hypothetical protein
MLAPLRNQQGGTGAEQVLVSTFLDVSSGNEGVFLIGS